MGGRPHLWATSWGAAATVLVKNEGDLGHSTGSGVETHEQPRATLKGAEVVIGHWTIWENHQEAEEPIEPPPQGNDYDLY